MAIERMKLYHVSGPIAQFDDALRACCSTGCFQLEPATSVLRTTEGYHPVDDVNPWEAPLTRVVELCNAAGVKQKETPPAQMPEDGQLLSTLQALEAEHKSLSDELAALQTKKSEIAQGLVHLSHIQNLDVKLDDIFAMKHIKIRFGRLPRENYDKLRLYDDNPYLLFLPSSVEKDYVWGVYFTPVSFAASVDEIFSSLYYERFYVPDAAHGTPREAYAAFEAAQKETLAAIQQKEDALGDFLKAHDETLRGLFCRIKYLREFYELRHFAAKKEGEFHLIGWIGVRDEKAFLQALEPMADVTGELCEGGYAETLTPPTKLRNNFLVCPFEMFVKMYGTPSYNELDPTPLVALTYTLLFGVMFGDLGHGAVLVLAGFLMAKFLKMGLGKILMVVGCSSMVFGVLFGSVFGNEEMLDGFYQTVFGLPGKPFEVTAASNTNTILYSAVAVGVILIAVGIIANIINGIKQRDFGKAFFSQNGLAGLIFYLSAMLAVVFLFLFDKNLLSPVYIILLIGVPLLLIFLREPLSRLVARKPSHEKQGIVEFIVQNFFELFEIVLSFITNTLSFLRVGAFTMSHAFMMSVVFLLAEGANGSNNPVVLVIGNLFVIGMEGLIVAIQVLRLQFYEVFSRFYAGEGKEYQPACLDSAGLGNKS